MPKFAVRKTLFLSVEVDVVVNAVDRDEALDVDCSIPFNLINAAKTKNGGWKGTVDIKPPKGVSIYSTNPHKIVSVEGASGPGKVKVISLTNKDT